jgi:hypothetical protein
MELNRLAEEIHATAVGKGWWGDLSDYLGKEVELSGGTFDMLAERNFGEVIALIHSEASEALEEYRNGRTMGEIYYSCSASDECNTPNCSGRKPEGVPSEMADIIIRVLDACAAYGIDIDAAVAEKMAYNKTRPHKHGGKRA